MTVVLISTIAVLSWWPVFTQNCGKQEDCAACVVQEKVDLARCENGENLYSGTDVETGAAVPVCFRSACVCSVCYCDILYLGLMPDGSVTWKIKTADEIRKEEIEDAWKKLCHPYESQEKP